MRAVGEAIHKKLLQSGLASQLGSFQGGPSIFTVRPAPENAGYPIIMLSRTISDISADSMSVRGREIVRDIAIYGKVPVHFDAVDDISEAVRQIFHREALDVRDFRVINVSVSGPIDAPVEAGEIGKIVTLTVRMDPK